MNCKGYEKNQLSATTPISSLLYSGSNYSHFSCIIFGFWYHRNPISAMNKFSSPIYVNQFSSPIYVNQFSGPIFILTFLSEILSPDIRWNTFHIFVDETIYLSPHIFVNRVFSYFFLLNLPGFIGSPTPYALLVQHHGRTGNRCWVAF